MQQQACSRRNISTRNLLIAALLCALSLLLTVTTSTAHAASPSNALAALLAKAGYVQVTQQNFRNYIHSSVSQGSSPRVISNATPGPYLFTDNIYSVANQRDVSAELGYSGGNYAMLRARTAPSAIGPWEVFNWYGGTSSNTFEIQSNANSLFVSAELGYSGGNYAMLRARTASSAIGPWEQFYWYIDSAGNSIIQSAANGLVVSAELGYSGGNYAMLRARTAPSAIGPWEQFSV